ncbi:hypothetical protein LCGC14_1882770, partial [marine sediment metagenome]
EDKGTALTETLPWCRTIDDLADAARALLGGTGSEAELARTLHNYRETGRAVSGQPGEGEPVEDRTVYKDLSKLRYP